MDISKLHFEISGVALKNSGDLMTTATSVPAHPLAQTPKSSQFQLWHNEVRIGQLDRCSLGRKRWLFQVTSWSHPNECGHMVYCRWHGVYTECRHYGLSKVLQCDYVFLAKKREKMLGAELCVSPFPVVCRTFHSNWEIGDATRINLS